MSTISTAAVGDLITAALFNSVGTEINSYNAAWTSFTPTLTASTTNPTLGTGSSTYGRYLQIGKLTIGFGVIKFGTSGTAAGSGNYIVSLPASVSANYASSGGLLIVGDAMLKCAGLYTRAVLRTSGVLSYPNAAVNGSFATANQAAPGAWTANDEIDYSFCYQAA